MVLSWLDAVSWEKSMKAPYMTNQINRLQCGGRPLGGTVALLSSSWSVYLTPVYLLSFSGFLSPGLSILFFFLSLLSSFFSQLSASLSLSPHFQPFFLIYRLCKEKNPEDKAPIDSPLSWQHFLKKTFFFQFYNPHSLARILRNKYMWVFSQT